MLGLRFKRVEEVDPENPWSHYSGAYEDQYGNTYNLVKWWHPGLWWLTLRDADLKAGGWRWEALKAAYQNRRTFIK